MNRPAFTLIELMIVVAIVAFLSMVSLPSFMKFLAKAKRAEAFMHLGSIYVAQKAFCAEHGMYSTQLAGNGGIGWKPEGYRGGGTQERYYYTYGFNNGAEGQHYFTGKLNAAPSSLGSTHADTQSFIVAAAGDIDGDGSPDVITMNHLHEMQIVIDDLA